MKIILLDRDGTVVVDPPDERVDSLDKVTFFPDVPQALKLLSDNDYGVIFVTNQAGIAEGRMTEEEAWKINRKVIRLLKPSGVQILKTYMCPHIPKDRCICRKPHPTMIQWATEDFDFEPSDVYFIGDRTTDVMAGKSAGTKTIQVETGNGNLRAENADHIAPTLLDAVKYVISH